MAIKISEDSLSKCLEVKDRKIITSSSAFGILRKQLVRNIGLDRIKDFLFHYGWEMGASDAKEVMKTDSCTDSLVKNGPLLHISNGHITGMQHDCTIEYDENKNLLAVLGTGIWENSYEAAEHIKQLGLSKNPVCHTLIGYASGYMSTVFAEPLYAKEIECVGKGDSECRWVIKTKKQWENEQQEKPYFYNETPIVKELEVTYEQLLEQQKFVTRLADFQKKLTEEISNGSDLQTLADIVFLLGNIPIVIEDKAHRKLASSGISDEKYLFLKEDMEDYLLENNPDFLSQLKEKHPVHFRKKNIKTNIQEILITPILVQKEVIGYCAFIYEDKEKHNHEEDYLFLDRFANAASLILLNEKTRFESFERMKGNFLEQILDAKLSASELIKKGKYTGLDLEQPYYITVMDYKKTEGSIEEEFLLQEQIFESTFDYFNKNKHNLLIGNRDGNMILFITKGGLIWKIP